MPRRRHDRLAYPAVDLADPLFDALAPAIALAPTAPGSAFVNARRALATPACLLALCQAWEPPPHATAETRAAMADALAALYRANA